MIDSRKKVRLLVVDSEPDYQRHLREIIDLCSHQYEIVAEFASSGGGAARQLLHRFEPSVVLFDVHAADREGVELLRGCSDLEVPVIATAESRNHEVEEQALRNGAIAFITRSEDPDDIESILHTAAHVAGDLQPRH